MQAVEHWQRLSTTHASTQATAAASAALQQLRYPNQAWIQASLPPSIPIQDNHSIPSSTYTHRGAHPETQRCRAYEATPARLTTTRPDSDLFSRQRIPFRFPATQMRVPSTPSRCPIPTIVTTTTTNWPTTAAAQPRRTHCAPRPARAPSMCESPPLAGRFHTALGLPTTPCAGAIAI